MVTRIFKKEKESEMDYKQLNILNIFIFILMFIYLNGFNLPQVQAGEKQHHITHVHGAAHIKVALEDNELYIEFISPTANIVGFEHHPETEKQKVAVRNAIKALKAGEELFAISHSAGAKLVTSHVDTGIESKHGHEAEDMHKDETGEHHAEEGKHHGEHHEEHEQERHSEFKAVYRFACKKPDKLKHMDVMLFQVFKGIQYIDVEILTRTNYSAFKLTAKKNRVTF